jgi:Zn-dependent protease
MLFFGFGWANPVPINVRYFKNPKRDMAICAVAGPISNLLLAILFALLLRVAFLVPGVSISYFLQDGFGFWLTQFFLVAIQLNVTLAVFNLLPIPPLDGSRLFLSFLPAHLYFKVMRYERVISLVLMLALFVGLLDTPIRFISNLFLNLIWRLIL